MNTLEERLKKLCEVRFMTLDDPDTIQEGCGVEIAWQGEWIVWLTDSYATGHSAAAYRVKRGEIQDEELIVGMGCDPNWGECKNVFGDTGETLEEAVSKLEQKVAILRENPDCVLLFTWDD